MSALTRMFGIGHSKPFSADEVDTAVNHVLREAEELCWLLRKRREGDNMWPVSAPTPTE